MGDHPGQFAIDRPQEDFLAVSRMRGNGLDAVRDAARARMRQAGMTDAQIASVESSQRVQATITVSAPISGEGTCSKRTELEAEEEEATMVEQ